MRDFEGRSDLQAGKGDMERYQISLIDFETATKEIPENRKGCYWTVARNIVEKVGWGQIRKDLKSQ